MCEAVKNCEDQHKTKEVEKVGFQDLIYGFNNWGRVSLVKVYRHRSVEQNREPRNRHSQILSSLTKEQRKFNGEMVSFSTMGAGRIEVHMFQ
jgi:hypothetical protein